MMRHTSLAPLPALVALLCAGWPAAQPALTSPTAQAAGNQQVIFLPLISTAAQPFSYTVDASLRPIQSELPPIQGVARPVEGIAGPDGQRAAFVANEVLVRPPSQDELNAF